MSNVYVYAVDKKNNHFNELLFVMYFYLPVFAKLLSILSISLVSVTLYIGTLVIILLSLYHNRFTINLTKAAPSLLLIIAIVFFFAWSYIFNSNSQLMNDFKLFCMNAMVNWFLLLYVKNWKELLNCWTTVGAISGIIPLIDSFAGNLMFEDYMVLGYEGLLPAFACCLIKFFYNRKQKYLFGAFIYLIDMAIFTNKGATLTAIVLFAMMYVYFSKNKKHTVIKLMLIFLGVLTIFLFRMPLLRFLSIIAKRIGFDSYSLNTIAMIVYGDGDLVFGLRTDLWNDSIKYILQEPLTGFGAGGFYTIYGNYPHNFLIEMCLTFGCIITLLAMIVFLRGVISTVKEKNFERQIFLATILIMWFIPLSISMSFWQSNTFWIFIGATILYSDKKLKYL